jgi:ATP-binding cassette subfamily B protein
VSFDILPGEHVAILGPSGSGKTTLARLVLGLYRPTAGRILIDGRDLAEIDLDAYRKQVGVVLQENLLLAGTIEDNIALGDDRPGTERAEQAARLAAAHEFITAMPNGYHSVVGNLGLTLSGGQRQRINLARALYRQPRLLILDEPTSSLDSGGEQSIQENLATALRRRTVLINTHSRGVMRLAHKVLVLEDGTVVDRETGEKLGHRQLDSNGGCSRVPLE